MKHHIYERLLTDRLIEEQSLIKKKLMQEEQYKRLLEETKTEATKLNSLNTFMTSDDFPKLDRENKDLLYEQQRVMSRFVQILGKRLELNGGGFNWD